jgi:ribosome-binding factor A
MKKGNTRHIRISDAIAHAVANVIRSELSDPRIGTVVTVMRAEVATDLKMCNIYVSQAEGPNHDKTVADLLAALQGARGFIRRRVAEIVDLRNTPELHFIYDDSIMYGMRMRHLIHEANKDIGDFVEE